MQKSGIVELNEQARLDVASDIRIIRSLPADEAGREIIAALENQHEFCVAHDRGADILSTAQLGNARPGHLCCMTAGTTASPKVIRRTIASWRASAEVNQGLFGLCPDDRYVVLGDLSHSLSLYAFVEACHVGATADLLPGLSVGRQVERLRDGRGTVLYVTPTMIRQLAVASKKAAISGDMRLLLIGGGHLDAHTLNMARTLFPAAKPHVFYGSSETSFIAIWSEASPVGSVGRPYPGNEIEIRRENGKVCGTDECGEIWVKSPYLFEQYVLGSSRNTHHMGSFLTVGEFGFLDKDQNLFLAGRRDRMFTVADQNLFPEEIEAMLMQQPGVVEAAILPVADRLRGYMPIAFVAGDLDEHDLDRLKAVCRQFLAPAKTPRRFVIVDDWPRLVSGKTDYRALNTLLEAVR